MSFCRTQVYFRIAEIKIGRTHLSDAPHPGRPRNTYNDGQILAVINVNLYESCRKIGTMFGSCRATVFRRLAWVHHNLNNYKKKIIILNIKKKKKNDSYAHNVEDRQFQIFFHRR